MNNPLLGKYRELIASVGSENNSRAWWATWISSKNRFNTPLLQKIEGLDQGKEIEEKKIVITREIIALIIFSKKLFLIWLWARVVLRGRAIETLRKLIKQRVYLIKTFAYSRSFNEDGFQDAFFGDLPLFLQQQKRKTLTIYRAIGCSFSSVRRNRKVGGLLPLIYFNKFSDFFRAFTDILKNRALNLEGEYRWNGKDLSPYIKAQYQRDLFGENTYLTFLMYYAFRNLAKKVNITDSIMPFENNPWEKMCTLALKEVNDKTIIRGYQHTVVPLASVNMFPAAGEVGFAPMPDRILTVGGEACEILKSYGDYGSISIEPGCALRFKYLEKLEVREKPINKKNLLVALEGVIKASEVIEYITSQANKLKDWKITLRLHPALPLEAMRKYLSTDPLGFESIKLSSNKQVVDDIREASAVMYWGSTVGLEALKMGVPLIHYDMEELLNYDPLFAFSAFKWVVSEKMEVIDTLDQIDSLGDQEWKNKQLLGIDYMSRYFFPVSEENLHKFII